MNAMRALCHPVLPSSSSFSSTPSPTPCCRRRLPTFSAPPRRRADRWILAAAPEAMASTQPWTAQEKEKAKEAKLWGGRFEDSVTDAVERFSESVSFDKALYKQDIMGSRAHARMLAHQVINQFLSLFLLKKAFHFLIITVMQGLMTVSDRDSILHGLDEIERRIEAGEFVWRMDREDVHMNIEAALTDMIGEPAKKLHTARSRNDQVVTDLRLWCREAIDKIVASIKQLQVHTSI
ncbi:hypothetical protein GW17_00012607 [Ensete ventricosum]|nr:hypothetical protein GW17_00012607 [Ensete ventricosum]